MIVAGEESLLPKYPGPLEGAVNVGIMHTSLAGAPGYDVYAPRPRIISKWSNGQTGGQITKLKLVKQQMYGRGKLDLLQARLIGAR